MGSYRSFWIKSMSWPWIMGGNIKTTYRWWNIVVCGKVFMTRKIVFFFDTKWKRNGGNKKFCWRCSKIFSFLFFLRKNLSIEDSRKKYNTKKIITRNSFNQESLQLQLMRCSSKETACDRGSPCQRDSWRVHALENTAYACNSQRSFRPTFSRRLSQ